MKEHYFLIKIVDDDETSNVSKFKITASKKGNQLPCGICDSTKLPHMEMIEIVDDDQHDYNPCIFF